MNLQKKTKKCDWSAFLLNFQFTINCFVVSIHDLDGDLKMMIDSIILLVLYSIKTRSEMKSDFKRFSQKWFCHSVIWNVNQSRQKAHGQPVNKAFVRHCTVVHCSPLTLVGSLNALHQIPLLYIANEGKECTRNDLYSMMSSSIEIKSK